MRDMKGDGNGVGLGASYRRRSIGDSVYLRRLRLYLGALRPWSFTASLGPVLLGVALFYKLNDNYDFTILFFTVLCALSVHGAGNLVNTYYDYVRGIDSQKKSDDRTLVDHILNPQDVSNLGAVCYVIGCFSFLVLCYLSSSFVPHLALLYFGGLSSSFLYTGGLGLKYLALGDILIFITFGPLTVLFAYLAQGGSLNWSPLLYAIPIAFNTEAILHANNMRDVSFDREAGIITLAILIGKSLSYLLLVLLLFLPYLIFLVLSIHFSSTFIILMPTIFYAFSIERQHRLEGTDITRKIALLNLLMSSLFITAILLSHTDNLPWSHS